MRYLLILALSICALMAQRVPYIGTNGVVITNNGPLWVTPTGATTPRKIQDRFAERVNVLDFGALADRSTDSSTYVKAAHDSLTNGGTIFIPNGVKFSLTVTNDNIVLEGEGAGAWKDYTVATAPYRAWLPVGTNPVVRVGDDSRLVRGTEIRNALIYNPNSEGTGIFVNSSVEGVIQNVASWGFKDCLVFINGSTYPCASWRVINFNPQPAAVTGSRGFRATALSQGSSYLTDIEIFGGHFNGLSSGTDTYLAEIDGTWVNAYGGYWDFGTGHGVLIAKKTSGTFEPVLQSFGVNLDAGGGGTVVTVDSSVSNTYPFNKWTGWTLTTGSIEMPSGEIYAIPQFSSQDARFFNPEILSGMNFVRSGSFTNHGTEYIGPPDSSGVQVYRAAGGHSFGGDGIGPVLISAGQIYFDNGRNIFFDTVAGTPFQAINFTAGDNLILSAPTNVALVPINGASVLYGQNTQVATTVSSNEFRVLNNLSVVSGMTVTDSIQSDQDSTAGNTRFLLYDVDNGTMERVTVGAADSGGTGFKVLRIPN